MNITDEMLFQAAPEAAERWLSTLPERKDCGHDFSLTFQAAMEPLLRQRRKRWRTLVLLAAVVAALGALLAFGVSAGRPDDYGVYTAQGDGYVSYLLRPKNSETSQAIHPLTPDWLPEGFVLINPNIYDDHAIATYAPWEDQGERFLYLTQWHGAEQSSTLIGNYQLEPVQVGGEEAAFIFTETGPMSYLLWTQGSDAFILHVKGVEQTDVIRFAENLKWQRSVYE